MIIAGSLLTVLYCYDYIELFMNVSYMSMYICNNILLLDWQSTSFIGALKVNRIWRWHGRVTEPYHMIGGVKASLLKKIQYCMATSVEYKFDNLYFYGQNNFYCEREHNF